MRKDNLVFDEKLFNGKKIKCVWCDNYISDKCSKKGMKVKARKSRRCDSFVPNEDAIEKEINRGKGIPISRLPATAYMTRSERKAELKRQKERLKQAMKADASHPMTGDLSRFKTTAD